MGRGIAIRMDLGGAAELRARARRTALRLLAIANALRG
jgi:hypothetical protein